MNILVCVKHVPREEDLRLDPKTGTLIRSRGKGQISELDRYALEAAVRIKEATGGSVTVLSMGLPEAFATLRYSVSVGADDAWLLSDRALAGSDAYATAKSLAAAIRCIEERKGHRFSLILCGKQASDSDTALVVPALAGHLQAPHLTGVVALQARTDDLWVQRKSDYGLEDWTLCYPAVISVGKLSCEPRYPTLGRIRHANHMQMMTLCAPDLKLAAQELGTSGSLTSVGDSFLPERTKRAAMLQDDTECTAAGKLTRLMHQKGLI